MANLNVGKVIPVKDAMFIVFLCGEIIADKHLSPLMNSNAERKGHRVDSL